MGDRVRALQQAGQALAQTPGVEVVAASAMYVSEPWGFVEQPAFLNAVIHARTTLGPLQLLISLQAIESRVGRRRTFHWGPREIDLDLLLYGDQRIERRGLTLPHPSMEQRAFVLVPLREISPTFIARSGKSVDQLISALNLAGTEVRLAEGTPALFVR